MGPKLFVNTMMVNSTVKIPLIQYIVLKKIFNPRKDLHLRMHRYSKLIFCSILVAYLFASKRVSGKKED